MNNKLIVERDWPALHHYVDINKNCFLSYIQSQTNYLSEDIVTIYEG